MSRRDKGTGLVPMAALMLAAAGILWIVLDGNWWGLLIGFLVLSILLPANRAANSRRRR